MADYNNKDITYSIFDLVSAVDYVGDLDAYLHRCETESLPCDIKYLKEKVADIRFELNSIMDRLRDSEDDKSHKDSDS